VRCIQVIVARTRFGLLPGGKGSGQLRSTLARDPDVLPRRRHPGGSQRREPARAGQIRTFRITVLDPAAKRIELELAG